MAILSDQVRQQLRDRFAETLKEPVQLVLYTRPGTGRLILPSGFGCATCDDARDIAEELAAAAPDLVKLEVVDVSVRESQVEDVPTLTLGRPGEEARISWRGLPAGFEFATVVDAIERASSGDLGLSPETTEALERVADPVEVMVFATPT
jgi:alkyl hydroperoxide reductase subunit AhpF